jgi:hypothetical protein
VPLTKVSSFLVVTQRRTATCTGTLEQLDGFARSAKAMRKLRDPEGQ